MQVIQLITIENPCFPSLIVQLSTPFVRSIQQILQILTWNGGGCQPEWFQAGIYKHNEKKRKKKEEACQAGIQNKGPSKEQIHSAL